MPDTAFAILFLMRSTKKSIEKSKGYDAGTLAGGQGLPDHLADVRLLGGQIMGKQVTGTPDALLDILSQPDHGDFRNLAVDPQDLIRQLSEEEGEVATGISRGCGGWPRKAPGHRGWRRCASWPGCATLPTLQH